MRPFIGALVSTKLPMLKGSSAVVQLSDLGLEQCVKKRRKNWGLNSELLKSCACIEALSCSPCLSCVPGMTVPGHTHISRPWPNWESLGSFPSLWACLMMTRPVAGWSWLLSLNLFWSWLTGLAFLAWPQISLSLCSLGWLLVICTLGWTSSHHKNCFAILISVLWYLLVEPLSCKSYYHPPLPTCLATP